MPYRSGQRVQRPLDQAQLEQLALSYVGRFATSRRRLEQYLERKLRERGWAGADGPDPAAVAGRMCQAGYVDDAAYSLAKARELVGRGFGARRLADRLRSAGIDEEAGAEALELAGREAAAAALVFARRRRIGPFAAAAPDPRERERAIAAMIRAGHGFALARVIVDAMPGEEITAEQLAR